MSDHDQLRRREFLKKVSAAGLSLPSLAMTAASDPSYAADSRGASAVGLVAPKLDQVRVGFVGVGKRGLANLALLMTLDGVSIAALADPDKKSLESAMKIVTDRKRPAPMAFPNGPSDYLRMLERRDIDAVVISTPWEWHAKMCVDALNAGKHAFVEVPAALTVDDCWAIVNAAEKNQRHCMMLENCCYGEEEMFCLNICRQGMLGELLHGEGAYIHDLRYQMEEVDRGTGSWRTENYIKRNGNLYPTHGLGPIAQYMGINQGDRFDYLSTVASRAVGRAQHAKKAFPPGHKWNQVKEWKCGDINTTIIKTVMGRSIMLQWDETSPRPYSRLNLIQGSRGAFAGFPNRIAIEGVTRDTHEWTVGDALKKIMDEHAHPLWKEKGAEAKKNGGHGGMDWLMWWRIVYCLRNGMPLDQSVYDAAAWSVIGPLSELSIARRSGSVDVPDFTRGAWKTSGQKKTVSVLNGATA